MKVNPMRKFYLNLSTNGWARCPSDVEYYINLAIKQDMTHHDDEAANIEMKRCLDMPNKAQAWQDLCTLIERMQAE